MFELIHEAGQLIGAAHAWFMAQPMALKLLVGGCVMAVLWVVWIIIRVLLVALRATFRGL